MGDVPGCGGGVIGGAIGGGIVSCGVWVGVVISVIWSVFIVPITGLYYLDVYCCWNSE